MRAIEATTQFKRDFKREKKGRYRTTVTADLEAVIAMLAKDDVLPASNADHALSGAYKDCRDCHIHPDLVLIYAKRDPSTLTLIRIGSHSELF